MNEVRETTEKGGIAGGATLNEKNKKNGGIENENGTAEYNNKTGGFRSDFSFLMNYVTKIDIVYFAIGVLGNIAYGAVNPIFLILFGDMTGDLFVPVDEESGAINIDYYAMLIAILAGVSFFVNWLSGTSFEMLSFRITSKIKNDFFANAVRQEISWFDEVDSGVLTTRVETGTVEVRNAIGLKLGQAIMLATMGIGSMIVAFYQNAELAGVLCSGLPLIALAAYLFSHFTIIGQRNTNESYEKAGSIAEEAFIGIRTVASLNSESRMEKWYHSLLSHSRSVGIKMSVYTAITIALITLFINLELSLAFYYGGILLTRETDQFGGGDVLIVLFCIITVAFAAGQLVSNIGTIIKGFASVKALRDVVERKSSIDPYDETGVKDVELNGDIKFDKVQFSFPTRKDQKLFVDLSLEIKAGEVVAIVGPSGVGKSTVLQMIQRLYDPDRGDVCIDGRPLTQYNTNWIRQQIAVVNQQPRLFSMSIRENIALGSVGKATNKDIMDAAKSALADKFITTLPDGYDTFVGEGGGMLSGGQKQRVAIARALVRRPKILLLDEATASLDGHSEKIVQRAIDKLVQSKRQTIIMVAHRLSTVINSDKIIVLNNPDNAGVQVAEIGSHNELMNIENGVYRKLMQGQITQPLGSLSLEKSFSADGTALAAGYDDEDLLDDEKIPEPLEEPKIGWLQKLLNPPKEISEYPTASKFTVLKFVGKAQYLMLGFSLIAGIFEGLSYPVVGIFYAWFMESLFSPLTEIKAETEKYAWIFAAFAVGSFLITALQSALIENVGFTLATNLRYALFSSLIRQDIAFFDNPKNSAGTLIGYLAEDILLVKGGTTQNLGIMLKSVFCIFGGIGIAFFMSWKLALVTMGCSLILIPAGILEQQFLVGSDSMDRVADVNSRGQGTKAIMSEGLQQIRNVAAFGIEKELVSRYHGIINSLMGGKTKDAIIFGLGWGFSQGGTFAIVAVIFWYGAKLINSGELNATNLTMVIFAFMFASIGISQLGIFLTDSKRATEATDRTIALINRRPKLFTQDETDDRASYNEVYAKNIKFAYEGRREAIVLNDVSFDVPKGSVVALTGESGCGKSTIIQLLERFYDIPDSDIVFEVDSDGTVNNAVPSSGMGTLLLNDRDIKTITVRSTRRQMGLVSQEPILFNTTIRDNICLGTDSATESEIMEAAKLSGASGFIGNLPEGYATVVGRLGEKLSGGQRQRVAIARALLQRPKILLLDEATSALDTESERLVQAALDSVLREQRRTTIVIAHRLSTIKDADLIVVLKSHAASGAVGSSTAGSYVAEAGKHDELIAKKGEYYRLFSSTKQHPQQQFD